MQTWQIRDLLASDVARIAATVGGPAWNVSNALWTGYLDDQNTGRRDVLIAIVGETVLGYGTLAWQSRYPDFAAKAIPEISNLVVAASARHQGIATNIVTALEDRARKRGKSSIGLGVGLYADYGAAQQLYWSLGYRPDGRGITYDFQPIQPGKTVKLDDGLLLWMTKLLD